MTRKRLWVLVGVAGVLLAVAVYVRWSGWVPRPTRRTGAVRPTDGISLADLRRELKDAYRLRPDARFLSAVADVHRSLTGEAKGETKAEFRDGLWHILYRGVEVGSVPELPGFSDFVGLLTAWAKNLGQKGGVKLSPAAEEHAELAAELERFTAPHAISAARMADELWGKGVRDAGVTRLGARALVFVYLQCLEHVEASDAVPARALAALALCKGLSSESVLREECTLADRMGYHAHSARLAESLPEEDPLRMYVRREVGRLEEFARSAEGTAEARYLLLRRISCEYAEKQHAERWQKAVDAFFPLDRRPDAILPVLKTNLDLGMFASRVPTALLIINVALREVQGGALVQPDPRELTSRPLSETVSRFEPALDAMEVPSEGPFIDGEVLRGYYRGQFYSGLYAMGRHFLDRLASIPASEEFLRELGELRQGPPAEFARWFRHMVEAKSGKGNVADLRADLEAVASFGAPPVLRTFRELKSYAPHADPGLLAAVRELVPRLDTRPDHLGKMSAIAYENLLDIPLAEKLYLAALRLEGPRARAGQAWYARLTGHRKKLTSLLGEPDLEFKDGIRVLENMEKLGGFDDARLQEEYEKLIARWPDEWRLSEAYAEYLERTEEYAKARGVIEDWLRRRELKGGPRGFPYIYARIALARMHYHEGEYAEGLDVIEPVVGSWVFGAMQRKALLVGRLGRTQDAVALARAAYGRYPDGVNAVALLAELCWRGGEYEEAAVSLKRHRYPIPAIGWRDTLGDAFVESFKDRPEEGAKAVEALLAQGLDRVNVSMLATRAAGKDHHQLAFEAQARIRAGGVEGLQHLTQAYVYLKKWKGEEPALDWLRPRLAERKNIRNAISLFAHQMKAYELLWELLPENSKDYGAEYVWLMRAIASLKTGKEKDPHRKALARYFNEEEGEYHYLAGRYMLGLTDEKELIVAGATPRERLEIAYCLGLKAQLDGRYGDASDWYRVTIETRIKRAPEYRWAYNQLFRWAGSGKSLERLAAEKE